MNKVYCVMRVLDEGADLLVQVCASEDVANSYLADFVRADDSASFYVKEYEVAYD